jgi:hypothetical protein
VIFKKVNAQNYEVQKVQDNAALAFQDVDKKIRGISGNYDLVMPENAPTSKLPLQMDSEGNVTAELAIGVTDGSSAAAGQIGEYKESVVSTPVNAGATATYSDVTSLLLTPGDWDLTGTAGEVLNGATITGAYSMFIGAVAGNNTTGRVFGLNYAEGSTYVLTTPNLTLVIPRLRVSITANTTYYLKSRAQYSAGTPQVYGSLTARRIR